MAEPECTPGEVITIDAGGKTATKQYCLTRGDSIGLALTAESGLISLLAIVVLFLLIIRNVWRNCKRPADERRKLLQEPADVLMLSLFAADLLQAIGAAMDIHWARKGFVEVGSFCTAQGAIQQLGETTVALNTMVIALQTFIAVWFRRFVHNMRAAYACVFIIWLFIILYTAVGIGINQKSHFYIDPTPFWCWIGQSYLAERITGEYAWMWLALFVTVLVYVPLFLWGRGYLTVDRTHWWRVSLRTSPLPRGAEEGEHARDRPPRLSLAILGYPVIYSTLILPLSIVRWITFARGDRAVPSAGTFAIIFIFGLSGAANVLLLLTTRPNLLLFDSHYYDDDLDTSRRTERGGVAGLPMAHVGRQGVSTGSRGRAGARWRLHEQGRIATPSRSSSRVPSIHTAEDDGYGFGLSDYNHHFSRSGPSDSGAPPVTHDDERSHSGRPYRVSEGTNVSSHPPEEHDLGQWQSQGRLHPGQEV